MNYLLMHKNIEVALLTIDEELGTIVKVNDIIQPLHLPIGTESNGEANRLELNKWWQGRSIPASRDGLDIALETLKLSSAKQLISKCFGLSLSDQYWIKPIDSNVTWYDINFFTNEFSQDIGDALFGKQSADDINFRSPDNTSDGWLKKRWKIADGKRVLIKGGSAPYQQEPLNEVIASRFMQRLGIVHVDYTLIWQDGLPYSVCKNMIDENTEIVPAYRVMQAEKQPNHLSSYQHLLSMCDKLGIPNVKADIDKMLTVDYILLNADRHTNNFGFIRNVETLQWQGLAPIFDTGSSLFYNQNRLSALDVTAKPFHKSHDEQLKLVTSLEWFNKSKLDGFREEIEQILSPLAQMGFTSYERIKGIGDTVMTRADYVAKIKQNLNSKKVAQQRTSRKI